MPNLKAEDLAWEDKRVNFRVKGTEYHASSLIEFDNGTEFIEFNIDEKDLCNISTKEEFIALYKDLLIDELFSHAHINDIDLEEFVAWCKDVKERNETK